MSIVPDRYYVFVDPALEETVEDPGGLVRRRPGVIEVYLGGDEWEDRYSELAGMVWDPSPLVAEVDEAAAERLISEWPPSKLRKGFRARNAPAP